MTLVRSIAEAVGWVCIAIWLGGSAGLWDCMVYLGPARTIITDHLKTGR